jgi:predicted membrane protein
LSINAAGAITGYYYDLRNALRGFVRATNGTITTFNVPGAGITSTLGTYAAGINDAGAIAGYYYDANNVVHGFQRTP